MLFPLFPVTRSLPAAAPLRRARPAQQKPRRARERGRRGRNREEAGNSGEVTAVGRPCQTKEARIGRAAVAVTLRRPVRRRRRPLHPGTGAGPPARPSPCPRPACRPPATCAPAPPARPPAPGWSVSGTRPQPEADLYRRRDPPVGSLPADGGPIRPVAVPGELVGILPSRGEAVRFGGSALRGCLARKELAGVCRPVVTVAGRGTGVSACPPCCGWPGRWGCRSSGSPRAWRTRRGGGAGQREGPQRAEGEGTLTGHVEVSITQSTATGSVHRSM